MDNKSRIGASSRAVVKKEKRSSNFSVPSHLGKRGGVMPPNVTSATNASAPSQVVVKEEEQCSYFITTMASVHNLPGHALPADLPKFCTMILDPKPNYLKIEHEFARQHGHDLPSTVFLQVHTSDKLWKVQLFKSVNGEILFNNGWEEFKQHYFLKFGDFLVFTFDASSSKFDVFLYDMTCTHIECYSDEENRSESSESQTDSSSAAYHTKNKDTYKVTKQEVGSSSSRANYSFNRKIKFSNRYRFELPKDFITGTGISSHAKILMKNVKGEAWPVLNTCRTSGRCTLGSGWHDFLIANKVIVGSELEFKFISHPKFIIEARVIKPGENPNEVFSCVRENEGRRKLVASHDYGRGGKLRKVPTNVNVVNNERKQQESGSRVGSKWEFSKTLQMHHVYKMDIPQDFVNGTGIEANDQIRLKVESGEEWPIEVTSDKRGYRYSMTAGWKDFLKDNKVFEGSTISFEFIPNSDNVIEVQVLETETRGKPLFNPGIRRR